MTTYYIHMLDGKPAGWDGERVFILNRRASPTLHRTLKQLRWQQMKSRQWYAEHARKHCLHCTLGADDKYNYLRVVTP